MDENTLNDLKEKHGELYEVTAPNAGATIIIKKPKRHHIERLSSGSSKKIAQASLNLIYDVCVHPGRAELDAMLDDKPALVQVFSGEILEIAGFDEEASVKKL